MKINKAQAGEGHGSAPAFGDRGQLSHGPWSATPWGEARACTPDSRLTPARTGAGHGKGPRRPERIVRRWSAARLLPRCGPTRSQASSQPLTRRFERFPTGAPRTSSFYLKAKVEFDLSSHGAGVAGQAKEEESRARHGLWDFGPVWEPRGRARAWPTLLSSLLFYLVAYDG